MNKKFEENINVISFKLFGMILLSLPFLLSKFGVAILRFKRVANKGGNVFQKELVNQGINKSTALELTEIYLEGSSILKSLISMR